MMTMIFVSSNFVVSVKVTSFRSTMTLRRTGDVDV
jgi:hypothetical protein